MKKNELWFRKLGFYNNPLNIKPAAYHTELLGFEDKVEEIKKNIEGNKLVFIEGKYGEGKTTLLKKLIYTFGGRKKVIYFSCNRIEERLKVRKLLNGRYGIIGKWFDLRPNNMILLLDEAQSLDKRDYEKLHRYYTSNNFSSIVFVGAEFNKSKFPEVIAKEINHFKLHKLSPEDAVKIVRKRIGELDIVSDDIIKLLWEKSGNNARKLLMFSEAACRYAVEYGEDKVTEAIIEKVLKDIVAEKPEPVKKTIVKKVKESSSDKKEEQEDKKNETKDILDEIEAELAEIDLESDDEEEVDEVQTQKVKVKKKKRVSPEEALNKSTEELLHDERFY